MLQYNVLYIKHITGERGSMLNFIRGFCMALADSVPGLSGGTVAFLLGFYDKFIMSLDYLMSGTKEERIEAIKFLIRIGIGWVVGMGAAVSVLASIFDDRIYEISSLFLGLKKPKFDESRYDESKTNGSIFSTSSTTNK